MQVKDSQKYSFRILEEKKFLGKKMVVSVDAVGFKILKDHRSQLVSERSSQFTNNDEFYFSRYSEPT